MRISHRVSPGLPGDSDGLPLWRLTAAGCICYLMPEIGWKFSNVLRPRGASRRSKWRCARRIPLLARLGVEIHANFGRGADSVRFSDTAAGRPRRLTSRTGPRIEPTPSVLCGARPAHPGAEADPARRCIFSYDRVGSRRHNLDRYAMTDLGASTQPHAGCHPPSERPAPAHAAHALRAAPRHDQTNPRSSGKTIA